MFARHDYSLTHTQTHTPHHEKTNEKSQHNNNWICLICFFSPMPKLTQCTHRTERDRTAFGGGGGGGKNHIVASLSAESLSLLPLDLDLVAIIQSRPYYESTIYNPQSPILTSTSTVPM